MSDNTATNLLIVAGVGLGAYFLTRTRPAMAGSLVPAPGGDPSHVAQLQAQNQMLKYQQNGAILGTVANIFSGLFGRGGSSSLGTVDGRAAAQWDVSPFGAAGPTFNNPSAYVAAASSDGIPYNPVNSAPVSWEFQPAYESAPFA